MRRGSFLAVLSCTVLALGVLSGCKDADGRVSGSKSVFARKIDTTAGHAPAGVRIKVEVLNASNVHGAARRATLLLRERGYDVVAIGNSGTAQDATLVLDRSHHPEWAALIAKAIDGKPVERPDTSAYLDATVVLGADWTPPPMPFHP